MKAVISQKPSFRKTTKPGVIKVIHEGVTIYLDSWKSANSDKQNADQEKVLNAIVAKLNS